MRPRSDALRSSRLRGVRFTRYCTPPGPLWGPLAAVSPCKILPREINPTQTKNANL